MKRQLQILLLTLLPLISGSLFCVPAPQVPEAAVSTSSADLEIGIKVSFGNELLSGIEVESCLEGAAARFGALSTNNFGELTLGFHLHKRGRLAPFKLTVNDPLDRFVLLHDQFGNYPFSLCGSQDGYLPVTYIFDPTWWNGNACSPQELELTMGLREEQEAIAKPIYAIAEKKYFEEYKKKIASNADPNYRAMAEKQMKEQLRDAKRQAHELGVVYLGTSDRALKKAIKDFSKGKDVTKHLPSTETLQKRLLEANQARSINEQKYAALSAARMMTFSGKHQQADSYYNLSIRIGDDNSDCILEYGRQLEIQQREKEAIQMYQSNLHYSKERADINAKITRQISLNYKALNQNKEAFRYMDQSLIIRENYNYLINPISPALPITPIFSPESIKADKELLQEFQKGVRRGDR
jgi:hypothetical protein